jgi:hypothetical protein
MALAVANASANEVDGRVFFVELTSVGDPALIATAIASVLGSFYQMTVTGVIIIMAILLNRLIDHYAGREK